MVAKIMFDALLKFTVFSSTKGFYPVGSAWLRAIHQNMGTNIGRK